MRDRTRRKLKREEWERPQDLELVSRVDALTDLLDWERGALEAATERVYRRGRALLPKQRNDMDAILARHLGVAGAEE